MKLTRLTETGWELVLDRAPVNAIGLAEVEALRSAVLTLQAEASAKTLVVTGAGRFFCAGADIKMMSDALANGHGPDHLAAFAADLQDVLRSFRRLPLCTIAAINGSAIGGGLELALSCDLRVAGREARGGLPEIKLGLIPAAGGTQLVSEIAGKATASRLVLTGEIVGGENLVALGLAQWAVDDALAFARNLASGMADLPRAAIAANKECISLAGDAAGYAAEIDGTRRLHGTAETRALIEGFFGRQSARPPNPAEKVST